MGQAFTVIGDFILPMAQDGTLLAQPPTGDEVSLPDGACAGGRPKLARKEGNARRDVAAPPSAQQQGPMHAATTPSVALHPADVVKAAKARAKNIRVELRNMKRLERELAELERLIAAAKQKPVAVVRSIDHARHSR